MFKVTEVKTIKLNLDLCHLESLAKSNHLRLMSCILQWCWQLSFSLLSPHVSPWSLDHFMGLNFMEKESGDSAGNQTHGLWMIRPMLCQCTTPQPQSRHTTFTLDVSWRFLEGISEVPKFNAMYFQAFHCQPAGKYVCRIFLQFRAGQLNMTMRLALLLLCIRCMRPGLAGCAWAPWHVLSIHCVLPWLGAKWVSWPSDLDFRPGRRSPSQVTHVPHLDVVFYLTLHRHRIQGTTV